MREAAEDLVVAHQDWARGVALRIARRLPPWVDRDDLVSAALWGLWTAAQRYDAGRGVPFRAFAYPAIRGECYMRVRRREWLESTHQVLGEEIAGNGQYCPEAITARRERTALTRAAVCDLLRWLDGGARQIVSRHWLDEIPLTVIAGEMDERPRRVYAIHAQAMRQLARLSRGCQPSLA